jgi:hypothetical protein
MKKSKLLGILMIIPTILLLTWIIIFSIYGTFFGTGSGASFVIMIPFLILSVLQLLILIFFFYFSLKLLKQKPLLFKENNMIANILIGIGILYFVYKTSIIIYSNISVSNPGGWLQPILAFLWGLILISLGLVLKKPNKKTL